MTDDDNKTRHKLVSFDDERSTTTSSDLKKRKRNNHCVHYCERCTVVLIPSRIEYIDAGIDLWYKQADFLTAMIQVQEEMDAAFSRESQTNINAPAYTSYMLQQLKDWRLQNV